MPAYASLEISKQRTHSPVKWEVMVHEGHLLFFGLFHIQLLPCRHAATRLVPDEAHYPRETLFSQLVKSEQCVVGACVSSLGDREHGWS
jgi:hypothetical protein